MLSQNRAPERERQPKTALVSDLTETMRSVARDVIAERRRQIADEGFVTGNVGALGPDAWASLAECMVIAARSSLLGGDTPTAEDVEWPLNAGSYRSRGARHDLLTAAAFIFAQIMAIDTGAGTVA